ncbi:MAG TPA: transglycosylase SLT domain-containing protein [Thermoanaerobaculia bacterium]|jgi:soluble lytic murein transglycosylase|nr:transglycosylase SLT domain-containing protein [Thermoanaerobaculia bacterium]
MITTFTLVLAATLTADPRPALVELQLAGRRTEALARTEREIAAQPETSRALGLDYLRGHLLDLLNDPAASGEAFAAAMANTPDLGVYSRYRLALAQERTGHPEVAAGLIASVVDSRTPALLAESTLLLSRTLSRGGDCRLLGGLKIETLPAPQRRILTLSQADCALRTGSRELARGILVGLLEENRNDDTARGAADRLDMLVSDSEGGRLPLLLGLVFHQHRDFERALAHLHRALDPAEGLSDRETAEGRYAQGRSHFWLERYAPAAVVFGGLATVSRRPEERARALYQQGRSYELLGQWILAAESFSRAYLAQPDGEWAAASLFAGLRLRWRSGAESDTAAYYDLLTSRREWREQALRASLFLASSDIVRGRKDRARTWLDRALPETPDERLEVAYWRGRLAELERNLPAAVASYLEAMRFDLYHPLSQSAHERLGLEPLSQAAVVEGRRRSASTKFEDLYDAWLLLGNGSDTGKSCWFRARNALLADPKRAPLTRLIEIPVRDWPLWEAPLHQPEEKLLALGILHEGAPAVRQYFPISDPSLAYTGCRLLSKAGEHERSILLAEALRLRSGDRVPVIFQPREFHQVLYPSPYREPLVTQCRLRGVPPNLLAAIAREESRYNRKALSPAAARGLTQLTVPTARRIATQIDMTRLDPEDLYRPDIALALGAAYLAKLLKDFNGAGHVAVAAYNAGEPQAALWRSYCFSPEMEEFFTKVTFQETRNYLRKVLTSRAHYEELW